MSNEFSFTDGITPELNRIAREMKNTRPLMAALGKGLEVDLRSHFRDLDSKPNARGWPRKHFWAGVRRNTALTDVSDLKAAVTIASPEFPMKVFGGTIYPKRGKALSIPNNAEAYRKGSPREWDVDELDFIPLHNGGLIGMLVKRLRTLLKMTTKGIKAGKQVGGDVMYWLVARSRQQPQADAWPPRATLEANALQRARAALARVLRTK